MSKLTQQIYDSAAEYGLIRTYLSTIISVIISIIFIILGFYLLITDYNKTKIKGCEVTKFKETNKSCTQHTSRTTNDKTTTTTTKWRCPPFNFQCQDNKSTQGSIYNYDEDKPVHLKDRINIEFNSKDSPIEYEIESSASFWGGWICIIVSIIVIISSLGQLYIVKHNKSAAAATAAINVLSVASQKYS